MCSDCEVHGLKKHGLTRSDWTVSYLVVATIETTSKVVDSGDTKHLRCTVTSQSPYVYHRLGMVNVRVFNVDLFLNKLKNLMGEVYIFLNETWKMSCMVSFIEMGGVILEL